MTYKNTLSIAWITIASLLSFSSSQPTENYFDITKNLDILSSLLTELNTYYVDEIDPKNLLEKGIVGILQTTEPYAQYIKKEDLNTHHDQPQGYYYGVGITVIKMHENTYISRFSKEALSTETELKIGDQILTIDKISTTNKSVHKITNLLRGKNNTNVVLTLYRRGEERNLTIISKRKKIYNYNIAYQNLIEGSIGYIKLKSLQRGATKEIRQAVLNLKKQGCRHLILDLRNHVEGMLSEAINTIGLFVPTGTTILSAEGKNDTYNKSYISQTSPLDTHIPLILLIDRQASPTSEIIAGVLQDLDRAVLIGEPTEGNQNPQTELSLPYHSKATMTTANYYLPSGRSIHKGHPKTNFQKDSTRRCHKFRTNNGRLVYGQEGVYPEIIIEKKHAMLSNLITSGIFFDYAVDFCSTHQAPPTWQELTLPETTYQDFMHQLKNTQKPLLLETQIETLIKIAKKENIYDALQNSLQSIKKNAKHLPDSNLLNHKNEIMIELKKEIVFHYNPTTWHIEITIHNNPTIRMAKKIVTNHTLYNQHLTPQ